MRTAGRGQLGAPFESCYLHAVASGLQRSLPLALLAVGTSPAGSQGRDCRKAAVPVVCIRYKHLRLQALFRRVI